MDFGYAVNSHTKREKRGWKAAAAFQSMRGHPRGSRGEAEKKSSPLHTLSEIHLTMRTWSRLRGIVTAQFFSAGTKNRGAMAGNGGSMTEARQQLREKRVEGKKKGRGTALPEIPESEFLSTGTTDTGQAHSTGSAQARGKPGGRVGGRGKTSNTANSNETGSSGGQGRKEADKEETEGEEGIERLQSVTSDLVKLNCGVLSGVLLERAKEGNLGSFRLLVALAKRKKPREEPVKKARGLTQAQQLALDPPYQDGMPGGIDDEDDADPYPQD
jgi:hypothetical protein